MNIFITGVAGFLGSHLANRLASMGHKVSGNDIFRQTKVLMGLVVVFVLCQSFTMVADVFELFCTLTRSEDSASQCKINFTQVNNLISCGHFMLAVNSTVNFVFYMIYIKEFRDSFLKV